MNKEGFKQKGHRWRQQGPAPESRPKAMKEAQQEKINIRPQQEDRVGAMDLEFNKL